jgi:hypothetical protein
MTSTAAPVVSARRIASARTVLAEVVSGEVPADVVIRWAARTYLEAPADSPRYRAACTALLDEPLANLDSDVRWALVTLGNAGQLA